MKFGDPKPLTPFDRSDHGHESSSEAARHKAEAFVRPRIHTLLESAPEGPDKKRFVIERITPFGRKVFQGQEAVFDSALERIERAHYDTDEAFENILVRELATAILEFAARSGFSEPEAKAYFRRFNEEESGYTPLDDEGVLSYSRFEGKIELHVTSGFTIELFKEDMARLAEIVRTGESIEAIKLTSWVVAKYKGVIRKLGFTLAEPLSEAVQAEIQAGLPAEMRGKLFAEAYMTRKEFLARYGGERE